jgi:hypothetical protein
MRISEKLDLAIKMQEKNTVDGAYAVTYKGETLYKNTYMTNTEWQSFLDSMSEEARREYGDGDGGELTEKNGRPPKMASFGSSSRMIYNLSREREGFHFERKLPTTIGGTANLDGFCEDENRYIFVEAKCHEPYTAKGVKVSKSYEALYRYINEQMPGGMYIGMEESLCGRYLNVEYLVDGERIERFDMKQMICHLLGIATGMLNGTLERKQTDFIYLLYDPTELDIEPEAKAVIDGIYERTCYECNLVDFAELYRVLLDFLSETEFGGIMTLDGMYDMIFKFTFTLASQEFYSILIQ